MAELTTGGKWAIGIGLAGAAAILLEAAAALASATGRGIPLGVLPASASAPAKDPYADSLGRTHMVVRIYGREPLPEPIRDTTTTLPLPTESLDAYEARIGKHAIMTDMGFGWEKKLAWPGPEGFSTGLNWPGTSTVDDKGQSVTLYLTGIFDTVFVPGPGPNGGEWKIVGYELRGPPSPMVP